jgi:hypothetical protein
MAKIKCEIEEITLENENGYDVPGTRAICGKCGHSTESFGTSESSILRCLATLRDECLNGEDNFYEED